MKMKVFDIFRAFANLQYQQILTQIDRFLVKIVCNNHSKAPMKKRVLDVATSHLHQEVHLN